MSVAIGNPDEWLVTGWALSLALPRPRGFARKDLRWVLPGWAQSLRVDELEPHSFPWSPSSAAQQIAVLALTLFNRLEPHDVPDNIPRALLPALLLTDKDWPVRAKHLEILGESWETSALARAAASLAAGPGAHLAARIWNLSTAGPGGEASVAERVQTLRSRNASIAPFVLGNVPPETVAETARTTGAHWRMVGNGWQDADARLLLLLPRATRHAAIQGWIHGGGLRERRFDEARELVPLLDEDDVELALELIRVGNRDVAAEFTSFVWRTAPERALLEADRAMSESLPSAEGWFHVAPREYLGRLADIALVDSDPPKWVPTWAMRRALDAGCASERLFDLASGARSTKARARSRPR